MADILVIHHINVERLVTTARFPQIGETIIGSSFNNVLGGKGANKLYCSTFSSGFK